MKDRILILDNYDSFTWNLVHYVEKIACDDVSVFRNDEITLEEVNKFDKIILSPGPGLPAESGILLPLIKKYYAEKKIFGICLGLQAIGEAFGGKLKNLPEVHHGIARDVLVKNNSDLLFRNVPQRFRAGRYHSWVINKNSLPVELKITAEDTNGEIMAIRHNKYDVKGVQFHPESILTEHGETIIQNWITEN